MSSKNAPPINDPIMGEDGTMPWSWILFMNQTYIGDTGTAWTPTFTSMGATGTPTYTGIYYKLSQRLVFFKIVITPETDTTSTAGTTSCDNFPLTFKGDGFCIAVSNNLGTQAGAITRATNKIFPPTWAAVSTPITILGFAEAQ